MRNKIIYNIYYILYKLSYCHAIFLSKNVTYLLFVNLPISKIQMLHLVMGDE